VSEIEDVTTRLVKLGLSENEVRVYVFLRNQGSSDATSIAQAVGVKRPNIYPLLDSLRDKGLVELFPADVNRYGALSIERYIESRIRSAEREITDLKNVKDELSKLLVNDDPQLKAGKMKFFSHRNAIVDTIERMTGEAHREIRVITTNMGVSRAAKNLFNRYRLLHDQGVRIRMLIGMDGKNEEVLHNAREYIEVRQTDNPPYMSFNIIDNTEMIMVRFSPDDDSLERGNDIGFWTDDVMIIKSFSAIYEQLWDGGRELKNNHLL